MKEINIPHLPFYFIRHGETDWNLAHKLMGQKDIKLNDNGLDQAYTAAYILADQETNKIFASPLKRAQKTGEIIADICELELEIINELKERNWGSLEGDNHNNALSFLTNDNLPPDGEEYLDFEKRIIEGTRKVLLSEYGYPVIVSHGGVFKVLVHLLTGRKNIDCPNCKIFLFTPSSIDNKWEIIDI